MDRMDKSKMKKSGSFDIFFWVVLLGLLALALKAPAQGVNEPKRAVQVEYLENHMVPPTPEGMLRFMNNGFPPDVNWGAMPEFPASKTDVYLYALQELGRRRHQPAFDTVSALARGETNPGLDRIIVRDMGAYRERERRQREAVLRGAVRYNAIVALGLLGDERAVPMLNDMFGQISDDRWRIQIALALATLGDGSQVGYLVELVKRKNQEESVAAHETLRLITGKDWGYERTTSVMMRDKLANDVALWWLGAASSFQPEPQEIIRRRYFEPDTRWPLPVSLRDMLRSASRFPDPEKRFHADYARGVLDRMGASRVNEIREVAMDEWEDVMVRREAMRRVADIEKKDSKAMLKKLRKDKNPEVAEMAKSLLERL